MSGTRVEAPERWGPTVTGGRRRRWPWVVAVLGVLVLVPVLGGVAVALYASGQVQRIPVAGVGGDGAPMQILVVGSDSREELTPEQQQELTTGSVGGERTDTIFLLTVDGSRAGILAFPRDLFVTRCDGSRGRINAAKQLGGPSCLVQTVEELSGIPIDHYLSVSFLGFRDMVDAAGGVEICLEQAIQDPYAGVDLPAGCQTLTGRQALGYVRVRKIDNDLRRIQRQQRFLAALADRLLSPDLLLDVPSLVRTAGKVGSSLTADEGFGVIGLARAAWGARSLAGGAAVTATVPATGRNIGGAAVLVPNEAEAAALFASFRDGSALRRADGSAARGSVPVVVLNGAGVAGLATETADGLETAGWEVADVGNAERTTRTTISHTPAAAEAARALAADLPVEATVREVADAPAPLTLVLGEDLRG